jgi:DNA-binding FadR family transcriptional regulator
VLKRQSLADQAAEVIVRRVASGEWPVGSKIPGEAGLAADLGVGRSTVREAIRELAGRGMLATRQGAGVFVAAREPDPDWALALRRAAVLDVIEVRIAVETEAVGRAASRRTADDLRGLDEALDRRARAARDEPDPGYVDADLAFHQALVAAAHNDLLLELFRTSLPRVRQGMVDMLALVGPGDRATREDHDAHAAVLAAVRDADPDRALVLTREHLGAMHRRVASGG